MHMYWARGRSEWETNSVTIALFLTAVKSTILGCEFAVIEQDVAQGIKPAHQRESKRELMLPASYKTIRGIWLRCGSSSRHISASFTPTNEQEKANTLTKNHNGEVQHIVHIWYIRMNMKMGWRFYSTTQKVLPHFFFFFSSECSSAGPPGWTDHLQEASWSWWPPEAKPRLLLLSRGQSSCGGGGGG